MKKMFFILAGVVLGLFLSQESPAQEKAKGLEITIYNQNLALVKKQGPMVLSKGLNHITISEVAALIDPTSVYFKSITYPDACFIREQNYEYDLLNGDKLLDKYIDKKIRLQTKDGKLYEGNLLSFDQNQIIIGTGKQSEIINLIQRDENLQIISFPSLPEELITKPTLSWEVISEKAGEQVAEISFLTEGINWSVDYIAVVNDNDTKLDLSGWVSINNQSGATYKEAKLKLVAGEIHRARKEETDVIREKRVMMAAGAEEEGFKETPFFEYHLYSLPRLVTLKDKQIKQISLLSAPGAGVGKLYIFDVSNPYGWITRGDKKKVNIKLELENSAKVGLGMALPKGKVRVYKADPDGSLQFVGEDLIDHTPKDEKLRLYVGDAFDVVGARTHLKTEMISQRMQDDTYEIKLNNHKDKDIEVTVVEHMTRGREWRIVQASHDFVQKDAYTVEFKVAVGKDKETVIAYTVRSKW